MNTHLIDTVQGCINRMASNSFQIKGWALAVATAIISFVAEKDINGYVLIVASTLPLIMLWALDAFFLRLETIYRLKHDIDSGVLVKPDLNYREYELSPQKILTSIEPSNYTNITSSCPVCKRKKSIHSTFGQMFTKTLCSYYPVLIILTTVVSLASTNFKWLECCQAFGRCHQCIGG